MADTAQVPPYPAGFRELEIATNGTTLHVRIGGQGPAVMLLHGYGETGDMWGELAVALAAGRTVIAPDLRGMGLSARPETGYDKKTQAARRFADRSGLRDRHEGGDAVQLHCSLFPDRSSAIRRLIRTDTLDHTHDAEARSTAIAPVRTRP